MRKIITLIASLLSFILGRWSWSSPPWLRCLASQQKNHPKTVYLSLFLLLSGGASYAYYRTLPAPEQVTAHIYPPTVNNADDTNSAPSPLRITFELNGTRTSAAALNHLDQSVNQQIELRPAFKGEWRWENESTLMFKPKKQWPAGQQYEVHFKKSLFAKQLPLA
ncbi:MAG: hypothetical protein Q9N68_14145, partial [Gammaproteobacteria bacterium]|nr:hypothetical protein [Gammaproteobacteria bacterium]